MEGGKSNGIGEIRLWWGEEEKALNSFPHPLLFFVDPKHIRGMYTGRSLRAL